MNDSSPVVVGVDFSGSSRVALEVAAAVCARAQRPLELVHVWNVNHLAGSGAVRSGLESWIEDEREARVRRLEEWASSASESGVAVTCRVVEGVASRMLPEVAQRKSAGLVVVGRRGSANLSHVLLGSVSERVVHQSACPVLVVPEKSAGSRSPERLLVGVDFSAASKDAYDTALKLAEALGVARGLVLVHVRPNEQLLGSYESSHENAYRGEYPYDLAALERWVGPPAESGVPVAARVLEGATEPVLVHAAKSEGCDWLVLGFQGQTALAAFFMGSSTDRVLKLADRPVLVVPVRSQAPGESS